jgi:hypothetical protein
MNQSSKWALLKKKKREIHAITANLKIAQAGRHFEERYINQLNVEFIPGLLFSINNYTLKTVFLRLNCLKRTLDRGTVYLLYIDGYIRESESYIFSHSRRSSNAIHWGRGGGANHE